MLIKTVMAFAFICIGFSQAVNANPAFDNKREDRNCSDPIINAVGTHLHMNSFTYRDDGLIIIGTCKIWPSDKSTTVAVFVSSGGQGHSDTLSIAIVNNQTNKVTASYQESLGNSFVPRINAEEDRVRIDTARYQLAPGVRAFGLDVLHGSKRNRYCSEEETGVVRTLFIKDEETIRSVFSDGLRMSSRRYVQGDPKCIDSTTDKKHQPRSVFENVALTIEIGENTNDGFANLWVTGVASYSDKSKPERRLFRNELKYGKHIYDNRDIGFYFTELSDEAMDRSPTE